MAVPFGHDEMLQLVELTSTVDLRTPADRAGSGTDRCHVGDPAVAAAYDINPSSIASNVDVLARPASRLRRAVT